jgi:hypothetical protein
MGIVMSDVSAHAVFMSCCSQFDKKQHIILEKIGSSNIYHNLQEKLYSEGLLRRKK